MKKYNKRNKSVKHEKKYEWYHLIPLMLILTIVPLIVHLKVINLSGASYMFWNGEKQNADFFSYYKMAWLIVFSVFSLIMLIIKYCQDDFRTFEKSSYYIPLVIYGITVIGSTILSQYRNIAASGFVDRYEGMYVLIAYIIILFATANLVKDETHIKLILGALMAGAVVLGTIGVFQYLGDDIWKSSFGKSLMLPDEYMSKAASLNFAFGKGTIYATLYHTDYVGSYMAMLFPLSLCIAILCNNKKLKIVMSAITLLMGINWIGCNSRAGMVGGVIAILVFLIMVHKLVIKNWKYFAIAIAVFAIMFAGFNKYSNGYLSNQVSKLFGDVKKVTASSDTATKPSNDEIQLKDVKIDGMNASIVTNSETLDFKIDNGQIYMKSSADKSLKVQFDKTKGKIKILDEAYKDYDITLGKLNDMTVIQINKGQIKFIFKIDQSSINLIDNKGNVVDITKPIEKWGFEGKERIGSSRGYIWSRSIPLLKHTIILGYGPDTFAIHFPQNDIMGKMYAYYGDMWQLVDKPHSMYLQTAINTGVISLIAMLALFGMYIVNSAKIYFKNDYSSFTAIAGLGVFAAVIGYLGAAFFNDSVVSVAPVFWILLGLGIAINKMQIKAINVKN